MEIIRLNDGDKRKYLDLLLTADEQESMIDRFSTAAICLFWTTTESKPNVSLPKRRRVFTSLKMLRLFPAAVGGATAKN